MDLNNIALLVIAGLNVLTAFVTFRTHMGQAQIKNDVATIEKATNSMKDALVLATGQAAHAAGVVEGVAQATAATAVFAAGAQSVASEKSKT